MDLQSASMQGFSKKMAALFLLGIIFFVVRNSWGMNTEALTPLLAKMTTADYTIARYVSLVAAAGWAVLYIAFHVFVLAYVLHLFTAIPFRKLVPLQLLVAGVLIMEKLLIFIVFVSFGQAASLSFLSLGPIAYQIIPNMFFIYFFNQLSITTIVIIGLQYQFIRAYFGELNRKKVIAYLIGLHVLLAILTATISVLPLHKIIGVLVVGGMIG